MGFSINNQESTVINARRFAVPSRLTYTRTEAESLTFGAVSSAG